MLHIIFSALRVRIIFRLVNRGGVVPFHHQHLLAQLIKGLILKGGVQDYFQFKNFNFSGLKGQTRVSRKGLHFFSSKITLVFSSQNEKFVNYVTNMIFEAGRIEIGSVQLIPDSIEKETDSVLANPTKFVCISPIVLSKPVYGDKSSKKFVHPETDMFSDLIFESTLERMTELNKYNEKELESFYKFQIVPDKKYIDRLDTQHKKYARIYSVYDDDVKYEVRGYTFPFTLYAPEKVLEFVYTNGIGYFSHKGFGMLDLSEAEAETKVEKMSKDMAT